MPARTNGGADVALLMLWICYGYQRWLHVESVKASKAHGRLISLLCTTSLALPSSLLCRLCSPSSPFGIPLFFFLRHPAPRPGDAPLLLFSSVTETRPSASSRCRVPSRFPARPCLETLCALHPQPGRVRPTIALVSNTTPKTPPLPPAAAIRARRPPLPCTFRPTHPVSARRPGHIYVEAGEPRQEMTQ